MACKSNIAEPVKPDSHSCKEGYLIEYFIFGDSQQTRTSNNHAIANKLTMNVPKVHIESTIFHCLLINVFFNSSNIMKYHSKSLLCLIALGLPLLNEIPVANAQTSQQIAKKR